MSKENECHEKFKEAWRDYPSQDNEGYVPDRGGFKCGWYIAWREQQEKIDKLKQKIVDKEN